MVRPLKPALASAGGTAVSQICAPDAFGAVRLDLLQLGLSNSPPKTTPEPGAAPEYSRAAATQQPKGPCAKATPPTPPTE